MKVKNDYNENKIQDKNLVLIKTLDVQFYGRLVHLVPMITTKVK